MEQRLKGDETYPKCRYCGKPIRDDNDSTSIGVGGDKPAPFHGDCFTKWCKEVPKRIAEQITGGTAMAGVQTAIDPETGEITDEQTIMTTYTETAISGKQLLNDRMRLGEIVRVTLTAQVVHVGESIDNDGLKAHVQKCKVMMVEDVQRGAI